MRQDNYPHPVSDPEAEGLPDYADDDSAADERALSTRISDGPDPAPLPADRPQGVDRFGTTAEEQRIGESVEYKLARKVPDEDPDPSTEDLTNIPPIQPNPDSPVSMYDIPSETEPVGRLVQPDEGVREDVDKDAIAYDAGEAGGGATAEELAMHEVLDR
jgi:hypothetical protein